MINGRWMMKNESFELRRFLNQLNKFSTEQNLNKKEKKNVK
ncbi:MAG TPA: hypothetical protein VLN45_07460 [Ignavibacteriaceae bacterium]|nr:hypothetical protein [Ignavibacteriaceae bacterium]